MSATEIEYQPSNSKNSKIGAKLTAARQYAYNPQDKTFFGRSGKSWAKIGLFYLVFYSALAGFFAVMLMLFFQTMNDERPNQTGMDSPIKGNPGMAFRPMPKVSSTLIKFEQGHEDSYRKYVDNIKIVLEKYKQEHDENDYQDCTGGRDENSDLPCKFDLSYLESECSEDNHFGYYEGEPCLLIKLNKVIGWQPEPYTNETMPSQLAESMPSYNGSGVAVTCEGENFGDVDNLGEVHFYPSSGFLGPFFPFDGEKGYQAPLVFMKLPNLASNVIVNVYCRAWAKNIYHHKYDKAGSFHFEVQMD